MENLKKYFIKFGLGGGYGMETEVIEARNEDEANKDAYYRAKESYEQFEGCGVQSVSDIIEEEGLDESLAEDMDVAYEIYNSSIEDSIDYSAELYDPEKHDDYLY